MTKRFLRFNKRTYGSHSFHRDKKAAVKEAKAMRGKGHPARIVKSIEGWTVYVLGE